MNKKWLAIAMFVLGVLGVGATGCKQGIGERCQDNEDCASNVCSSSSPRVCVSEDNNQTPIDGIIPPDTGDATAVTDQ